MTHDETLVDDDASMTTEEHVQTIAESITNGQHKQAREQFANARFDGVTAKEILFGISSLIGDGEALKLAAHVIENN